MIRSIKSDLVWSCLRAKKGMMDRIEKRYGQDKFAELHIGFFPQEPVTFIRLEVEVMMFPDGNVNYDWDDCV